MGPAGFFEFDKISRSCYDFPRDLEKPIDNREGGDSYEEGDIDRFHAGGGGSGRRPRQSQLPDSDPRAGTSEEGGEGPGERRMAAVRARRSRPGVGAAPAGEEAVSPPPSGGGGVDRRPASHLVLFEFLGARRSSAGAFFYPETDRPCFRDSEYPL